LKGVKDMAIEWKKERKHRDTSSNLLDRLIDGKVVDTAEMYDRTVLYLQLGVILGVPQKEAPKRVR
jgi:hypothetical protein